MMNAICGDGSPRPLRSAEPISGACFPVAAAGLSGPALPPANIQARPRRAPEAVFPVTDVVPATIRTGQSRAGSNACPQPAWPVAASPFQIIRVFALLLIMLVMLDIASLRELEILKDPLIIDSEQ